MNLTRSGIAYDLNRSPHTLEVEYGEEKLTFMFSSNLYKDKFKAKQEEHRMKLEESLTKRFSINIRFDLISDIRLYSQIEKRGFLILSKENRFECLSNIRLDGLAQITRK